VKLTCRQFGSGNCEAAIDRELERLLARKSGWLVFSIRMAWTRKAGARSAAAYLEDC